MNEPMHFHQIRRILSEAATPGKPETMAQRHTRMSRGEAFSQKQFLAFSREVLKDWNSGDMALSRLEVILSTDMAWLTQGDGTAGAFPEAALLDALAKAFRKKIGKQERVARMGKGHGFNPGMGRITPNEIRQYLELVVDFVQNDWPGIEAKMKG